MKVLITSTVVSDHVRLCEFYPTFKCEELLEVKTLKNHTISQDSRTYSISYAVVEVNVANQIKNQFLHELAAHLTEASKNKDNLRNRSYQHHANEVLALISAEPKPNNLLPQVKMKMIP